MDKKIISLAFAVDVLDKLSCSLLSVTKRSLSILIDARAVEEKIAKARVEASNRDKEKEKDKDKVEEKRISRYDEKKLRIGTPLVNCSEKDKPLSIAVKELYEGKVKILSNGDETSEQ